ncbi:hypothetical protein MMC11_007217 [Xylographa trunciseda]|nr:hypothetical protein [Xylographa trunciseda]
MKPSSLLFSGLLLATNLLAAPHGSERRNSGGTIILSRNWAGAILDSPADQTFDFVYGRFTVPNVSPPPGSGDGSWGSSAWVGLSGVSSNGFIQTGINLNVNSNSGTTTQSFAAWYEWLPGYAAVVDMAVSVGDEIALTVNSNSDGSAGTITIENLSNGQYFNTVLTPPVPNDNINATTAEWIVEDYFLNGDLVSLADFGTLTFTDCVAGVGDQSFGIDNSIVVEMASDVMETSVNIESSISVQITYLVDGPPL